MDHLIKVFQPVTLPIDIEDMGSVEKPIQDSRSGHLIGGKDMDPLFHRPVGSGDGQFSTPAGITVDSSGNVFVADTYNYRIQKFQKH